MKAVVTLSGGMDSTTAMAQAINDGFNHIVAVTIDYGSKHNPRELRSAQEVVAFYNNYSSIKVEHQSLTLPDIFGKGGSALMPGDGVPMPEMTYEEIMESEGPSPTVVPFRNANIISLCTTIAVIEEAQAVYVGMHATDANNWAYPDCTPEFLGAMANAVFVGSYKAVRLAFPLIWLSKEQVCERGLALQAPLGLTYSCYEGREQHCGKCPTCIERIEAFSWNGVADLADYEIDVEWRS